MTNLNLLIKFIISITNYYNITDGNLGVLFNGLKGSGKFWC